jgi:hypothetical protein
MEMMVLSKIVMELCQRLSNDGMILELDGRWVDLSDFFQTSTRDEK